MAMAVSGWFDAESEARIRDLWRELDERGINSTLNRGPYRPHITLALYRELDGDAFAQALQSVCHCLAPVAVNLSYVGLFPNNPLVAFLAVTQTEELRQLHRAVHKLLTQHGTEPVPYYLPDRWNPHCTLAPDLDPTQFPALMEYLTSLSLPLTVKINRLGVIETPAEIERHEVLLG